MEIGKIGFIKLPRGDIDAVANILFKNDYACSVVRRKKDGRSYEYFLKYEYGVKEVSEEDNEG